MLIVVNLKNCGGCRHRDHSGSFTPGGPKQICAHPEVSDVVYNTVPDMLCDDANGFPSKPTGKELERLEKQCYHWKNRIVDEYVDTDDKFPIFCPLRNGSLY